MDALTLFDLSGKTAVITGGGQGIGREITLALSEAGANVVIAQRNLEVAKNLSRELNNKGRHSYATQVDVAKKKDIESFARRVFQAFSKIDILINNAGISEEKNAVDISENEWDRMIDTHLKGTFFCCQTFGRKMIEQGSGTIINISSISGFIVNRPQNHAHYNTAKAAITHLTRCLAAEWSPYNIRVNAIAPGYIRSPMTENALEKPIAEEWRAMTPMGRIGEAHELRGPVLFLASEASSYVTGSVLLVDGGYTCW